MVLKIDSYIGFNKKKQTIYMKFAVYLQYKTIENNKYVCTKRRTTIDRLNFNRIDAIGVK